MTWRRATHPTGVPFYTAVEAPGYEVEAIQRTSCHSGMVFGQMISNADQGTHTTGWRVVLDGRRILQTSKLAQAKAAVERRVSA